MLTFNTAVERSPRRDARRAARGRFLARITWLLLAGWTSGATAQASEPHRGTAVRPALASPAGYEWFLRGELLRAEGRYAAAAAAFDMARGQVQPTGSGAWLRSAAGVLGLGGAEDALLLCRLADTLDLAGHPAQADDLLAEARRSGRRDPQVALTGARIAERRGEPARAMKGYRRAIALAPDQRAPVLALAALLAGTGHRERAAALLGRLPDDAPAALRRALLRQDLTAARLAALEVMARAERSEGDVQETAARLLAAGQPGAAYRLLAAIPADRVRPAALLQAALAAGMLDTARRLLQRHPPGPLGGRLTTARALLCVGRAEDALALARLAPPGQPGDPAGGPAGLDDPGAFPSGDPEGTAVAARARLAMGALAVAAELAMAVPAASRHRGEADAVLDGALRQAALPALADELLIQRAARPAADATPEPSADPEPPGPAAQ